MPRPLSARRCKHGLSQMVESGDRIVSPVDMPSDKALDITLRPRTMDEYIGQQVMREKLTIFLVLRDAAMRHLTMC